MKSFTEWMKTGPLAEIEITERERALANLAYNEAALQQHEAARTVFERILNSEQRKAA